MEPWIKFNKQNGHRNPWSVDTGNKLLNNDKKFPLWLIDELDYARIEIGI